MLVSCKYCGGLHERGTECQSKPKRVKENSIAVRFRNTNAWRKQSKHIAKVDNYLCLVCKAQKKYVYDNLEVHHIVPIAEDYTKRLDDGNLITLCVEHHKMADANKISREELRTLIRGRRA